TSTSSVSNVAVSLLSRSPITSHSLVCAPAPSLALAVAESALHLSAVHLAREVAPQARLVDVGEADVRAAQARLAQTALRAAERHGAVDLLEGLLERDLGLLAAGVEAPGAHHVRRHDPEVGAPAIHRRYFVGFPVLHGEGVRGDAGAGLHRQDGRPQL